MANLGHESETVEFKKSTAEIDEGIISMTAMLNRHGKGKVLFGVKDDGEVIGVCIGKDTLKNLTSQIFDSVDPHIVPSINVITEEEKDIIEVCVEGDDRPYAYKNMIYIRSGEEDRKAPMGEIRRMFRSSSDLLAETIAPRQDLTFTSLKKRLESKGYHTDSEEKLDNLCSLKTREGAYSVQGFLLSDQNNSQIIVSVFSGTDRTVFSTRNIFSDRCLLDATEDVTAFVTNLNETGVEIGPYARKDIPLFQKESFREAWINACVHNAWILGSPPSLQIFDDRMEILSFGGIPYWLSKESFLKGMSSPVNESLMRVFMMAGICEHTGHGIPIITNNYGSEAFELSDGTVKVTLPFPRKRNVARLRNINNTEETLNDNESAMLNMMAENPSCTLKDVAESLGITNSKASRVSLELQERGLLERIGSKKNGRWKVNVDLDIIQDKIHRT